MPKTYRKVIQVGGVSALASSHFNEENELRYQRARAVHGFAREAGIEFSADLVGKSRVTDLPRVGDYAKQLVELDL